ncbi:rhamnogalacturonan acetylesterase [Dysgonomonas sp. 520]|uniref:rhamnogalacturonan acetylesterase n=1 Tax=Dysgonomonas sp. 520 TaxID=2302931 RepID=UPI0013D3DFA5|nr:rhamnogalacturonan acetylesterase [Dysgonomonas sp. 520]NDW10020.1 hypothetical protein [Dysgonomonas sp. 520]
MKKLLFLIFFSVTIPGSLSFAQVRILTIGDSTMADYDEVKNSGEKEKRGWAQMLPLFLKDNVKLDNAAKNGRSSKSFYYEFWGKLRETLKPGDYVFIQFGHNDEKADGQDTDENDKSQRGTAAWGQYQKYMELYISESREKGAIPILLTPVVRRLFDKNNNITDKGLHNLAEFAGNDSTMNYPLAMRYLAKKMNVPLVDMTLSTEKLVKEYGAEKSKEIIYAKDDNTHLKAMGGILFSKLAVEDLIRQDILTDYLSLPSGLQIKPSAVDFGRQFVGRASAKTLSVIGMNLEPKEGYVMVSVKEPFSVFDLNNKMGFSQVHAIPYSNGTVNAQLQIRFDPVSSKEYKQEAVIKVDKSSESQTIELKGKGKAVKGGKEISAMYIPTRRFASTAQKDLETGYEIDGLKTELIDGMSIFIPYDGWPSGDIDVNATRYIEFSVTAPKHNLYIDNVSFNVGAIGGKDMYFTALGSLNKDFSETDTFAVMENLPNGKLTEYNSFDIIEVPKGKTYYVRIYPWNKKAASDKYFRIERISIKGLIFKK